MRFGSKRTEKFEISKFSVRFESFGFFCALLAKAHSARGDHCVNRKHHPAERCDLRFGSKRTENFSKRTEKFEITRGAAESREQGWFRQIF